MTVSVGYIQIGNSGTIPGENNVLAIRRPHRVTRMLDLNQLLDRQLCGFPAIMRCSERRKHERHDQHDLDHFAPPRHQPSLCEKYAVLKFHTKSCGERSTSPTRRSSRI